MSLQAGLANESKEALKHIVTRIKAVVEEERELLASANFDGVDRLVERKDQLAIELSRFVRRPDARVVDAATRGLLDEAAKALGSNADLLGRHIDAANEVAGIICNILVDANSDGTYTNNAALRGAKG